MKSLLALLFITGISAYFLSHVTMDYLTARRISQGHIAIENGENWAISRQGQDVVQYRKDLTPQSTWDSVTVIVFKNGMTIND